MGLEVTAEIQGLDELERRLVALPSAVGIKVMRSALLDAAKPIRDAARERVHKRTGALARSIGLASGATGKDGAFAGIRMARKLAGWRWHFEEFGTSRQRARPFLRPAFDEQVMPALRRFSEQLSKRIERAARS